MKVNKYSESGNMNKYRHMRIIYINFPILREIRALKLFLLLNTIENPRLLFVFLRSLFTTGEHYASTTTIQRS